ncbi:phosphoglycolate phosphatase haloacid dehalogenase hydrolase [Secundilactobacillus pentosiphilus]|uniref:Phosphoglycolate phosphatase haloacid dehalogenase hydrolase n=1 Tax=Secundilactobacillus pentosiphilus TaxID=1714682 RepID=A0A1Z5IW62_9LACO|nr:HAD-IA family hydrolase [Secundilactobacillus pentosiphilus]GAX06005.1 phosphoglycolate phosphatase haloacid dehalogenase hydrolase [Secundilactobacillus pentosiphilus]
MKYQSFFWDFDGTIFDTYPIMVRAFMQALMQQRVSEIELDEQEIYETMRQHSFGTARQKFSAEFSLNAERLEQDYRQIERQQISQAQPFAGMLALLQQLADEGGTHYLLTHRNQSAMALLETAGIKKLFTDAVTSEQPFPRKPDPASLNALIERHKVQRPSAIMIGDRTLDIDAGHNAGISGALFDPGRLIDSRASHPEIDVTNVIGLRQALLQ